MLFADLIKPVLTNYMGIMRATEDHVEAYKTSSVYKENIHGELIDVYSKGERYYLFEGNRFFYSGIVDENNLIQTIKDDIKRFGLVILAFKHLEEENYLSNLVTLYEEPFARELNYVLGFCTVRLAGGTILSVHEFINFLLRNGHFGWGIQAIEKNEENQHRGGVNLCKIH